MRWEVTFYSSSEAIHAMQSSASLDCIKTYSMVIFRRLRSEKKRIAKIVIRELEEGGATYVREVSDMGKPQSNWNLGVNNGKS